jgi:hypothetical protein
MEPVIMTGTIFKLQREKNPHNKNMVISAIIFGLDIRTFKRTEMNDPNELTIKNIQKVHTLIPIKNCIAKNTYHAIPSIGTPAKKNEAIISNTNIIKSVIIISKLSKPFF